MSLGKRADGTTAVSTASSTGTPLLFQNRDFALLWSGQVISTFGSAASSAVYPILILAVNGSPLSAGIAAALRIAPYVLLSLPAGALVDRFDRRLLMVACDLGRGLALAVLAIVIYLGIASAWQIYIIGAIEGALYVLFNIAETSSMPRILEARQISRGAAANEAGFGAAAVVGPSFGTLSYDMIGRFAPFVVDALSYGVSAICLLSIRTSFRIPGERPANRDLLQEIKDGIGWLWAHKQIRFLAFLTGAFNLVNASSTILIVVLSSEFAAGAGSIGLILSIGACGGVVGALAGGWLKSRYSLRTIVVGAACANACIFPLYAVSSNLLALGLVLSALYFIMPIYNVAQVSYRLGLIPDQLQGRVNSCFRLIAYGGMPLGALAGGAMIQAIGPKWTVMAFTGWLVIAATSVAANRHLRRGS